MLPIIILGVGSVARIAADILRLNDNVVYGFFTLETHPSDKEDTLHDISILGTVHDSLFTELVLEEGKVDIVIAEMDIHLRREYYQILQETTQRMPRTVIHPAAIISDHAFIGQGNIIGAGVCIQPDAKLGDFSVLMPHAVIETDATVEKWVNLGTHAVISSGAIVEEEVFVGSAAVIASGIVVQRGAQIAPSSLVINSVGRNQAVAGNPAAVINK
jgi:sugar O-acyltransferase (sialic acid O-acetyltransferase NeuD family)